MKKYVDKDKLQEFATKLHAKQKTLFAAKGETATDEQVTTAVSAWLDTNVDPVGSAVVVDSSLSVSGAAADAKVTGDKIIEIDGQISVLDGELFKVQHEPSNMTKDANEKIYLEQGYFSLTTGKATAASSGKYYRTQAGYAGTGTLLKIDDKSLLVVINLDWIRWSCWSYSGPTNADATHSNTDQKYISGKQAIYIPKNTIDTRFSLSFRKTDDTVFTDGDLINLKNAIKFYNVTDSTLSIRGAAADAKATGDSIQSLRNEVLTKYTGSTPTSVMDLPGNVWWAPMGSVLQSKLGDNFTWTLTNNTTYIIRKYQITTNAARYELMPMGGAVRWTGYTLANDTAITWYETKPVQNRRLRVLVFGSSFSYSTLGLVPAVMKEIAPDLDFTLGILYISGGGIEDHIEKIQNDSTYTRYSVYTPGTGRWTNNANDTTADEALNERRWDYIALQPRAHEWDGPNGDTPGEGLNTLETLENMILNLIDYPTAFLYNIPQSNGRNHYQTDGVAKSDALFADIVHFAEEAVKHKYVWDALPGGTAVQNARKTTLATIGVEEDMCYDNNGHLQNGIGTLVPAYAAAGKLLELSGLPAKILNVQLTPTDAWLSDDYNLYTASLHGPCVGVTSANKLIAQKCAIAALKNPYEITD